MDLSSQPLSISLPLLLLVISSSMWKSYSRGVEFIEEGATEELKNITQPNQEIQSNSIDHTKVTRLSWHPRAFLYEGFLSNEECDHLISLARGKLEKSRVIDTATGKSALNKARTSSGMFLNRDLDEVVRRIEERIAAWTFLPKENGEPIQILNYGINERYDPHYDYYHDKTKLAIGGHRIATVLMYLSNVTRGGETVFPRSEMKNAQLKDAVWSGCAATGYALKPIKGNALLFFSLHLNGDPDERSLHGGCKVLEGEKWSATKWIHVQAFDHSKKVLPPPDSDCTDEDERCAQWASIGQCQRNPVYMLGTPDYYGSCRKSCGVC